MRVNQIPTTAQVSCVARVYLPGEEKTGTAAISACGSGRRPYRTQPVPRLLKVAGQARGNLSVALEDSGSLASYLRIEEARIDNVRSNSGALSAVKFACSQTGSTSHPYRSLTRAGSGR